MGLLDVFIAQVGVASAPPNLEALLAERVGKSKATWPTVRLDDEVFVKFLGERVEASNLIDDLSCLFAEELYLTCACSRGDAAALREFEGRYFPDVEGALRKMRLDQSAIDEVKQTLRKQLFVRGDNEPPRIAQFFGRGPLGAWLRVSAVRAALKLKRQVAREVYTDEDDMLLELPPQQTSPELEQLKKKYREDFKAAFLEALGSLPPREKTLLRQHLIDGLSIDRLGVLYQVHRATAARWLERARAEVLQRTKEKLSERTALAESACESIMRMAYSQLDFSLSRLL